MPRDNKIRLLSWEALRALVEYFRPTKVKRQNLINSRDSLAEFLDTRSSWVAQTSLYGYLRTRAGTRFPEMFEHPQLLGSINVAKWQMWLACLSDLAVFGGGLILHRTGANVEQVAGLMQQVVEQVLAKAGTPAEAGDQFNVQRELVCQRLAECDWSAVTDDDACFVKSPAALVYWAPVVDELKWRDDEIVRNSVRFRWQEVRRHLRAGLDGDALFSQVTALDA